MLPNTYYTTLDRLGRALEMCRAMDKARATATPCDTPLPAPHPPNTEIATTKKRSSIQVKSWA